MKIQGIIKVLLFEGERVSIKLGNARFLSQEREWKEWNDWEGIENKRVGKGEIWISSFEDHVFQGCHELEKEKEVEAELVQSKRGFWNIKSIGLKLPEHDVNKDLEPPFSEEETPPWEETPSSTQRDKDSPEAQAEEMAEKEYASKDPASTMVDKETLIIRQTCLKAIGSAIQVDKDADWKATGKWIVALAKMLENYVLGT